MPYSKYKQVRLKNNLPEISRDRAERDFPAFYRLVVLAEAGEYPDFLDVMAALSEVVAFCVEGDNITGLESRTFIGMSHNNCRFCS